MCDNESIRDLSFSIEEQTVDYSIEITPAMLRMLMAPGTCCHLNDRNKVGNENIDTEDITFQQRQDRR